jgi:hypothetical protein
MKPRISMITLAVAHKYCDALKELKKNFNPYGASAQDNPLTLKISKQAQC